MILTAMEPMVSGVPSGSTSHNVLTNVLANVYAQAEYVYTMFFSYAQELEYQHCLICKKLRSYCADLQGVDHTIFSEA